MLLFQRVAAVAIVSLLAVPFGFAADLPAWPQWRGPDRTGEIADAKWPDSLDEATLKKVWRVELSPSYSGPIMVGDKIFVTETVDRKFEVVTALNRADGKAIWKTKWEGALSVPFFAKSNGDWIRATPAYDDGRLYVAGMRDLLVCLNAETGEIIWKLDFVEKFETPAPAFGFVSSPQVLGDSVYVQAGGAFVRVNKTTGEVVWRGIKDGGGMFGSAFSSPVFAKVGGVEQFIVQTRQKLAGVNVEDGAELWSMKIPAFRGMNILTPTVWSDRVFTSSYGGKSILLRPAFDKSADKPWQIEEEWNNKTQAYMSSPVVIGDYAYLHLRNQRFVCIHLGSGETKWTTTPFGKYWSMVQNGEKILALDEKGELLLIKANPEKFELLDRREVSEDSAWAHLAISGKEIAIRELKALSLFRWEMPPSE